MSEDQFTKLSGLISGVAEQVEKQGRQIEKQGGQIGDLNDQILKLYQHMEQRFEELGTELAGKADKADIERIYALLDTVAKNQEAEQQERLVINHQLDRHEGWINQLAHRADVKLSYD